MRSVVFTQFVSLDGVAEEPSDWFFDDGPELFALIDRILETQSDVLLGRGTYDYWVGYWPTSNVEPFASFINRTRKHVRDIERSRRSVEQHGADDDAGRRLRTRSQRTGGRRHRHTRQHGTRPVVD